MHTRKRWWFGLAVALGAVLALAFTTPAWANRYAGNYRNPAYGVKADITTPSTQPTLTSGVIYNWAGNDDSGNWLQCGWAKGDGATYAPDWQLWPTTPTSYEECQIGSAYTLYLYSSQPLNLTRTYEVVSIGSSLWQVIIAGTRRYSFGPFNTPTQVEVFAEISGSSANHTWASFNNVQYKGQVSYMPFDQNHERHDDPPYASFTSYSKYTCYNGM